jgi:transposase-like protein
VPRITQIADCHRRDPRQGPGRAGHQPAVYVAIGASVNGERDILGLWAGDGGEGAKFWLSVLTEIKNRSVEDVCAITFEGRMN